MNISFFDIIRHKVAVWVVFPMLLVLSVSVYQYAYYTPTAIVIELNQAQLNSLRYSASQQPQTPVDEFGSTLQAIKELTSLTLSGVEQYEKSTYDEVLNFMGIETDAGTNLSELEGKIDRVIDLESVALESFSDVYGYLIEIDADEVIFERHEAAVEKFKDAMEPIKDIRSELKNATTLDEQQRLLRQLDEYLSSQQFKHTHTAEDFENGSLPFGPRNLQAREPLPDLSALEASLYDPVDVASNALTQDVLRGLTAPSALPNEDDLAETEEAPQTQAIIDLAASLNNDPIEIYNWVYNNIYSIPSYGAIQGAQYTMDLKAGNPFDTSALLLALLRAAGTPARYAYGTVEVPVDQVMNWVGGAEVPEAATNVMLQGGIPSKLIMNNGQITHVKFEHIWVEAWVDYEPSRGLVNKEGDHWIPMDAGFKQYDFEVGQNLESSIDLESDPIFDTLVASVDVDTQSFAVSNIDHTAIQQSFQTYQQQLQEYIEVQNPDATLSDIIGLTEIPIKERTPLAAGLPYNVLDRSNQIQQIPDFLKHKFRVRLDYDDWGGTAIDKTVNTISLAGKDVAISFRMATQKDTEFMAKYLPDYQEGQELNPEELPDTVPGYLVHLKPELLLGDSEIIATGSVAMGSELTSYYSFFDPSFGWNSSRNKPVAGEYISISLNLQGISLNELRNIDKQVDAVSNEIDDNGFTNITKHDLIGLELKSNIVSYMALNDFMDNLLSKQNGMLQYRTPSYGQFNTAITTSYWFGIPRNTTFSGVVMDVDRLGMNAASQDGEDSKSSLYSMLTGYRASLLENWVPEQFYSEPGSPEEGMSASKAISMASLQGQAIYTLDKNKLASLDSIVIDSDARNEIRAALLGGNIVTVHEAPLSVNGWTGSGYIIQSENGSSAYKISGGFNGGVLDQLKKGLQKVSSWLDSVDEALGDAKGFSGPVKALLGKVKKWVNNLIILIDAIQNCGPAGLILAIPILLFIMWATAKIVALASAIGAIACAGIGLGSGGVGGFICLGVWYTFVTVLIIDIMASVMESIASYINNSNGLLCRAGT